MAEIISLWCFTRFSVYFTLHQKFVFPFTLQGWNQVLVLLLKNVESESEKQQHCKLTLRAKTENFSRGARQEQVCSAGTEGKSINKHKSRKKAIQVAGWERIWKVLCMKKVVSLKCCSIVFTTRHSISTVVRKENRVTFKTLPTNNCLRDKNNKKANICIVM